MAAALLGGCALRRESILLQGHWTRPVVIQSVPGRELCLDLLALRVRKPMRIVLEATFHDSEGKSVASQIPEAAGAGGELGFRRELLLEPRPQEAGSVCSFLPLEAFPDPDASYGFLVLLKDPAGQVLGTLQGTLSP